MTVVGKILVFMNLLFSLATAALIAVVFSTRTNWKTEFEKARNMALAGEAAYKAEVTAHQNDLRSKDELIASLNREKEELGKSVVAARADAENVRGKLQEALGVNTTETNTHKLLKTEVENLKVERAQMASEKAQREAMIIKLQNDVNEQRKISVGWEVAYKSSATRNEKLLTAYEGAIKENNVLKQFQGIGGKGGDPTSALTGTVNPPPPKDVRGLITAVNEQGLAQINIGTDSGVNTGNTLDVFRPDLNNPKASVYLGKLTIRRAEPKAAVGQFQAAAREKLPKAGDEVAASITGR